MALNLPGRRSPAGRQPASGWGAAGPGPWVRPDFATGGGRGDTSAFNLFVKFQIRHWLLDNFQLKIVIIMLVTSWLYIDEVFYILLIKMFLWHCTLHIAHSSVAHSQCWCKVYYCFCLVHFAGHVTSESFHLNLCRDCDNLIFRIFDFVVAAGNSDWSVTFFSSFFVEQIGSGAGLSVSYSLFVLQASSSSVSFQCLATVSIHFYFAGTLLEIWGSFLCWHILKVG